MKFNFHRIISQTKSTQILYGLIGTIYGASNVIEYYPQQFTKLMVDEYNLYLSDAKNNIMDKKEITKHKEIVEKSEEELKKIKNYSFLEIIYSLGEIIMFSVELVVANNKIDENKTYINMIKNKNYIEPMKIDKPLFLINNNNLSTNIAISSMFYGSLFAAVGTVPIITFIGLSSYAIYNNFNLNKSDSNNKSNSNNK